MVSNWPLATSDWGLAVDPSGGKLYISNYVADAVSVVDTSTHSLLHSWTTSANAGSNSTAFDAALQQIYVRGSNDGTVAILSSVDGTVKSVISTTGGRSTSGLLALNHTTHNVYIAGTNITVLDGNTNTVTTTITVGSKPIGVAIDELANKIYTANNLSGTISVIDGSTNSVVQTWTPPVPSGSGLWDIAVDPVLKRLFVVITSNINGNENGLMTLDSTTGAFIGQVLTGVFGFSWAAEVAVNRTTHNVFMTDANAGTVVVVNGSSPTKIVTQVDAGGFNPIGIAVDETNGLVYVANSGDGTFGVIRDNFSTVPISVQTNPAGLSFSVDGVTFTSTQTFNWLPGESHTIATTTPQSGSTGSRYVWSNWSDGGAISHTITVPFASTAYTAAFTTQYLLTVAASPTAGGSDTLSPLATNGYYNSGLMHEKLID